jgi:hypothetical protein
VSAFQALCSSGLDPVAHITGKGFVDPLGLKRKLTERQWRSPLFLRKYLIKSMLTTPSSGIW